jgi:toxin ParE1/3/4
MAQQRVIWSSKAEISLERIYKFIAQDSDVYAYRFVKSLMNNTEKYFEKAIAPGRSIAEFENTPLDFLQEIIYKGYRIIYDPTASDGKIYIVLVISGRMSISKHI